MQWLHYKEEIVQDSLGTHPSGKKGRAIKENVPQLIKEIGYKIKEKESQIIAVIRHVLQE